MSRQDTSFDKLQCCLGCCDRHIRLFWQNSRQCSMSRLKFNNTNGVQAELAAVQQSPPADLDLWCRNVVVTNDRHCCTSP